MSFLASRSVVGTWALSLLSLAAFAACGGEDPNSSTKPSTAPSSTHGTTPLPTPTTTAPPAPTSTGTSPPVEPPPAASISFPQAQSSGGQVIAAPKVVPIVFASDPTKTTIADFHQKFASSAFWKAVATEYGIGAITPLPPVVLTSKAPANISGEEVDDFIRTSLEGGTLLGAPDSNTLYIVYYPAGTTISLDGMESCVQFGGYHYETAANGKKIGYAVMPHCEGGGQLPELDYLTIAASHEVFEWATDPFPLTAPAYSGMAKDFAAWEMAFLGELGDLCTGLDANAGLVPADIGYRVQRMWSNKSAAAGHNPCAPVPDGAYFVGVPMVTDAVDFQGTQTKGVSFKAGKSVTLPIRFHSDDPKAAEWDLQVVDSSQLFGSGYGNGNVQFALQKSSGKSGDATSVVITSSAPDVSLFFVVATRGAEMHLWPSVAVAK